MERLLVLCVLLALAQGPSGFSTLFTRRLCTGSLVALYRFEGSNLGADSSPSGGHLTAHGPVTQSSGSPQGQSAQFGPSMTNSYFLSKASETLAMFMPQVRLVSAVGFHSLLSGSELAVNQFPGKGRQRIDRPCAVARWLGIRRKCT